MLHDYPFRGVYLQRIPKTARQQHQPDAYRHVWLSVEEEGAEGQPSDPNLMIPPIATFEEASKRKHSLENMWNHQNIKTHR